MSTYSCGFSEDVLGQRFQSEHGTWFTFSYTGENDFSKASFTCRKHLKLRATGIGREDIPKQFTTSNSRRVRDGREKSGSTSISSTSSQFSSESSSSESKSSSIGTVWSTKSSSSSA